MIIPEEAKSAIAHLVAEYVLSLQCPIAAGALEQLPNLIERELEVAGYVVIPISEFGFPESNGPNP